MAINTYPQIVKKELHQRMTDLSFKKKGWDYVYTESGDTFFSVNFGSRHSYSKEYIVSVHVGVGIKNVNRLFIELTNNQDNKYTSEHMPFFTDNIGYVMPQHTFLEWYLDRDKNCLPWVDNIIDAIRQYGFPYYERMKDFHNMLNYIELGKGIIHSIRDYYYPVMLYLAGRKEEGLRHIERILSAERYHGPDLERYVSFANNYKILLTSGT